MPRRTDSYARLRLYRRVTQREGLCGCRDIGRGVQEQRGRRDRASDESRMLRRLLHWRDIQAHDQIEHFELAPEIWQPADLAR
ncbi:MAG: hypothetical protein ACRD2X_05035, partial [Vicinamibacteraceae bacterium]